MTQCNGPFIPKKQFKEIAERVIDGRRLAQKRSAWLNNVHRVLGLDIVECVRLYDKIQPYQ